MPVKLWVWVSAGLVAALIYTMLYFAPDRRLVPSQTILRCKARVDQTFDSMQACIRDIWYLPDRCTCDEVVLLNPWHLPYNDVMLPLVVALFGCLILRGRWTVRLALLNGSVASALLVPYVIGLFYEPDGLMGIFAVPWYASVLCLRVSIAYGLLVMLTRAIAKSKKY